MPLLEAEFGNLVPGRECGACTACCTWMWVDAPDLKKSATLTCRHVVAEGCAIHAMRPRACRVWFCGWRHLAEFGEPWRPDLSGVIALFFRDEATPGFEGRSGLNFYLISPPEKIALVPLIQAIGALIARGAPVRISRPRGPDHEPVSLFLNEALAEAVVTRDGDAMLEGLMAGLEQLDLAASPPMRFSHDGPDFAVPAEGVHHVQ